ncbi:MAG: cell division protein CrgA [Actinomycetia bacterium]|nr:cell division protein CrgA [Actinomycetes bacterium]
MPKSRSRKKADYISPPERTDKSQAVSGRWVAPTMIALLLIGLTWVVLYYVAASSIDLLSSLGAWNIAIGFGFMFAGLMVATRWK